MRNWLLAITLSYLLAVTPAALQAQPNMVGMGAYRCGAVLERLVGDIYYLEAIAEWAFGFYTGANMANIVAHGGFKDLTGPASGSYADAARSIVARCRINPNMLVIEAAEQAYSRLPDAVWD